MVPLDTYQTLYTNRKYLVKHNGTVTSPKEHGMHQYYTKFV